MTTIVAVRHGETTWNRERRMQGWAPTPLTDVGCEQATTLGGALDTRYDIDRIYSSDLHRTEETTELLLDHVDAPVTYESAWREHDIGIYQGLPADEMFERFPEYGVWEVGAEAAYREPESGETLASVRERVVDRWERLLVDCEPSETVLVVSHGNPIRFLLGHVKGLELTAALEQSQGNCAINEFQYDPDAETTKVVCENETDYS
ncbi:histidine phosphatase family protein [Haloarchaeobius sp. DFWS5]|uniref:histidine phosphatase family protein n=1 Tax=Haloarchaeobius sp. DFWS5 TaxID=3446114 RepID=UPI003EBFF08B